MYILRSIYIIYTYIYFEVYTYAGNLFLCVWTLRRRGYTLTVNIHGGFVLPVVPKADHHPNPNPNPNLARTL